MTAFSSAMHTGTMHHMQMTRVACACQRIGFTRHFQQTSLKRVTLRPATHHHAHQRRKRKRTAASQQDPNEAPKPEEQRQQFSEGQQSSEAGERDSSEDLATASTDPSTMDWREFRARLIASDRGQQADGGTQAVQGRWAHNVVKPEKGCLLLSHPLMFSERQTYFSQAVIFLLEHDDIASAGFILNRPTEHVLGKLVGADNLCPEFADNTLYLGGDVGHDVMHFLHGYSDIQGAIEVVQGVFMGGYEEASASIKGGSKDASQFRWFNRYAGWGPGQLEAECKAGVWFPVAASSDVILNPQNLAGRDMWHTILEMMGGDYASLSQNVKDAYPENMPKDS